MKDEGIEDWSGQWDTDVNADKETEEGVGEDFDDFEAGADDDFGDFDEEFPQPPYHEKHESLQPSTDPLYVSYVSPFVSRSAIRINTHSRLMSPPLNPADLADVEFW